MRTVHAHAVAHGTPDWADYVDFRERLRHDSALRREYDVLKRELARVFNDDRKAYTHAKAEFVRAALRG